MKLLYRGIGGDEEERPELTLPNMLKLTSSLFCLILLVEIRFYGL
jgi:hypothetical protein